LKRTKRHEKRTGRGRQVIVPAFALALAALHLVPGCVVDDVVDAWTAQTRVNAAYFAKLQQCEQSTPFFLLFVPNDVQESDVRLCEAEILAAACPAEIIPASCILLAFRKAEKTESPGR